MLALFMKITIPTTIERLLLYIVTYIPIARQQLGKHMPAVNKAH
jgi:hypothetical protein